MVSNDGERDIMSDCMTTAWVFTFDDEIGDEWDREMSGEGTEGDSTDAFLSNIKLKNKSSDPSPESD